MYCSVKHIKGLQTCSPPIATLEGVTVCVHFSHCAIPQNTCGAENEQLWPFKVPKICILIKIKKPLLLSFTAQSFLYFSAYLCPKGIPFPVLTLASLS